MSESTSSSESESSSKKDGRDSVVMLNGLAAGWYDGKGVKETVVVVGCVGGCLWVLARLRTHIGQHRTCCRLVA